MCWRDLPVGQPKEDVTARQKWSSRDLGYCGGQRAAPMTRRKKHERKMASKRSIQSTDRASLRGAGNRVVDLTIALGLVTLLVAAPWFRGLYFIAEQLVTTMAVSVLVIGWVLGVKGRDRPGLTSLEVGAGLLVLAFIISTIVAVNPREAVQAVLRQAAMFGLLTVGVGLARSRTLPPGTWLAALSLPPTLTALLGAAAAAGVFQYRDALLGSRIASTLQYPNTLAAFLTAGAILATALSVAYRDRPSDRTIRSVASAAAGLNLLVLIHTQSRGGLLVLPVAFALFIAIVPRQVRLRATLAAGTAVVAALLATPLMGRGIVEKEPQMVFLSLLITALASVAFNSLTDSIMTRATKLSMQSVIVAVVVLFMAAVAATARFAPTALVTRLARVGLAERSVLERLTWARDGLAILQDHLLFGVGGGGWASLYFQYQQFEYWTSQVHNDIVQVALETGLIGVAAFSFFLVAVVRALKIEPEGVSDDRHLAAKALLAAGLAIILHSAIDFNLSLMAIGLFTWTALGVGYGLLMPGTSESSRRARDSVVALTLWHLIPALVALVAAGTLLIADRHGEKAVSALEQGDLSAGREHFEAAIRFDPLRASYRIDLAQIYGNVARQTGDGQLLSVAYQQARRGLELDPQNPKIVGAYGVVALQNGWIDEGLWAFRRTLDLHPYYIATYENAARAFMTVALHFLETGRKTEAADLLTETQALQTRLQERSQSIPPDAPRWRQLVNNSPGLAVWVGQAKLLAGDPEGARREFEVALGGPPGIKAGALAGLAILSALDGDETRAKELRDEALRLDPRIEPDFLRLQALVLPER